MSKTKRKQTLVATITQSICDRAIVIKDHPLRVAELDFLQHLVAENSAPIDIVDFAEKLGKRADKALLQQAILESGDAYAGAVFAHKIKGAKTQELQSMILCSRDADAACYYAKFLDDADIPALTEIVIQSETPDMLWFFANILSGRDSESYIDEIGRLENVVIQLNDPASACMFATHVTGAHIEPLQDVVLRGDDPVSVMNFAYNVDGADIDALKVKMRDMHSQGIGLDYGITLKASRKLKANH